MSKENLKEKNEKMLEETEGRKEGRKKGVIKSKVLTRARGAGFI